MSYRVRTLERSKTVSVVWEADSVVSMPPAMAVGSNDKCITLDDGALWLRDGREWVNVTGSVAGGAAAWGAITGTIGDQTDLQTALGLKAASVHTHAEADVTGLVADLALKAPLASPAFTGTPTGITKAHVGLGSVDNTSDAGKPVSTAQQTALDLKANLAGPTFTGTVVLPAKTVTLAMQADMTTASLVYRKTAGAGAPEINTLATVKTDLALVKGDVGLGSVDNTADTAKPVSTAQQTALNLKADLASPAFSGTPSLPTGTTATTQSAADSSTKLATTAFATTADNLKANLASPTFTGTVTVPGLTINDATDLTINATTGSKIGQAGSKIGFFGIAPVVRPSALTQTYSTASATHAAITSLAAPAGGVGTAAGGWSTAANRDLAIATINADRTDLVNLKNFVNQIVDQLQLLGILQ